MQNTAPASNAEVPDSEHAGVFTESLLEETVTVTHFSSIGASTYRSSAYRTSIVSKEDPAGTLYFRNYVGKMPMSTTYHKYSKRVLPTDPGYMYYRAIAFKGVPNVETVYVNEGTGEDGQPVVTECSRSEYMEGFYNEELAEELLYTAVPARPLEYANDDYDWELSWDMWAKQEQGRMKYVPSGDSWVYDDRIDPWEVYVQEARKRGYTRCSAVRPSAGETRTIVQDANVENIKDVYTENTKDVYTENTTDTAPSQPTPVSQIINITNNYNMHSCHGEHSETAEDSDADSYNDFNESTFGADLNSDIIKSVNYDTIVDDIDFRWQQESSTSKVVHSRKHSKGHLVATPGWSTTIALSVSILVVFVIVTVLCIIYVSRGK